jgi:hypothetical protein
MKLRYGSVNVAQITLMLLCGIVIAGLSGCKAEEGAGGGFIDKSDMAKDPSLPFHKVWVKPGLDKSKYTKVYIAPVNTSYMLKMTEWQQGVRKDEIEQDVAKLAAFTQETIKKAFREDPNHRLQVVDEPGNSADTMIVEVALIEVVPSKVVLNALGYTPFYIGLTLNAVRTVAKDVSTTAFEARIRDAATGEVIAKVADRESQQVAIVSVRGLTWYGHAETNIKQWAEQFVKIANRKPGEMVKDTDTFTLMPW